MERRRTAGGDDDLVGTSGDEVIQHDLLLLDIQLGDGLVGSGGGLGTSSQLLQFVGDIHSVVPLLVLVRQVPGDESLLGSLGLNSDEEFPGQGLGVEGGLVAPFAALWLSSVFLGLGLHLDFPLGSG